MSNVLNLLDIPSGGKIQKKVQNEVNIGRASMAGAGENKPEPVHLTEVNGSRDSDESI